MKMILYSYNYIFLFIPPVTFFICKFDTHLDINNQHP